MFTKKIDTAWSQILETKVNREGQFCIIVFRQGKSLADRTLTEADLFSFYSGEEVRQQFTTLNLSSTMAIV